MVTSSSICSASEASTNDLLVVHTRRYLDSLKWSATVAMIMEVPPVACVPNWLVNRYALRPFRLQTGGTILAARLALERQWAINLGGGFHHCSSDRGGGFCAYADISLALRFLLLDERVSKAMIVDLDAHQGNGHETDFAGDERVFILDMYNSSIYPGDVPAERAIRKAVKLRPFTQTDTYLRLLSDALTSALDAFKPDVIAYNAGTDCLDGDPLGSLSISAQGIVQRDEMVFRMARDRHIPIFMVTSGGYQRNNARIIADSILNLRDKALISLPSS